MLIIYGGLSIIGLLICAIIAVLFVINSKFNDIDKLNNRIKKCLLYTEKFIDEQKDKNKLQDEKNKLQEAFNTRFARMVS